MMNQMLEWQKLEHASHQLSAGIPQPGPEVPAEVAETLKVARIQMLSIPDVIADLEAAQREFVILERAIDRLNTLAQEAVRLPEEDQQGREEKQAAFVKTAHIVARIAGRSDYLGPSISLTSNAEAKSALRIVGYVSLAKEDMAARLADQEQLIIEAVEQTVDFLTIVAESYPDAASLAGIPDLLERVSEIRPGLTAKPSPVLSVNGLH